MKIANIKACDHFLGLHVWKINIFLKVRHLKGLQIPDVQQNTVNHFGFPLLKVSIT